MNSWSNSSAWPALPFISTVRSIAMIYSSRNSALFALRDDSLCSPARPTLCVPLSSPSGFKKLKTCNSRLIHFRARETSSSSSLNSWGVSSRYLDSRFEPTRREKSWWRYTCRRRINGSSGSGALGRGTRLRGRGPWRSRNLAKSGCDGCEAAVVDGGLSCLGRRYIFGPAAAWRSYFTAVISLLPETLH